MSISTWRATRVTRVALVLTWAVFAGACADDAFVPTQVHTFKPSPAFGDVLTVTTAADGPNLPGSLRYVVRNATGGETIRFAPGLAGATIMLDSALAVGKHSLIIEGPGDKGITLNA